MLGLQVIEIIQNEIISAGNEGAVLLHTRVASGQLSFTMKCTTNEALQELATNLNRLS